MNSIRPVGPRLLVEVINEDDGESGYLLHVPDHIKRPHLKGIVRGVGGRCKEFSGSIGDMVTFDRVSGNKIAGFEHLLVIHEKNILAMVEIVS